MKTKDESDDLGTALWLKVDINPTLHNFSWSHCLGDTFIQLSIMPINSEHYTIVSMLPSVVSYSGIIKGAIHKTTKPSPHFSIRSRYAFFVVHEIHDR